MKVVTQGRRYHQVQSLRDVTRSNFPNGQIRFNWSVPSEESWNPYLSFFRLRCTLPSYIKIDDAVANVASEQTLKGSEGIAPVMFFNDSLWQQLEFRINGVCINKQDNYCHQIAALKHRLYCPEDKNQTLNSLNFHQTKLEDRAARFATIGKRPVDKPIRSGFADIYDLLSSPATATVSSNNVGAGNACTITFGVIAPDSPASIGALPGQSIHVKLDNDIHTDGTITAITANTIVFTSRLAGQLNGGVAAALARGQILINAAPVLDKERSNVANQFETIWRPKLGIFDINDWLPGGDYEIILTPFPTSSYRLTSMEAKYPYFIRDINFEILNIDFHMCACSSPSKMKSLELIEIRCQAKTINTTSLSQKQFNINPKVHALTVAYQDNRVQTQYDLSSSEFKIKDLTAANWEPNWERNLSRFYIQYDGQVLPNPIPDIRRNNSEDFISQYYWEHQMYKLIQYENIETLEDWKERGPYFHFAWPRRNPGAVEVQISTEFAGSELPNGVRPQLLLFEHYKCRYSFEMYKNYITKVKRSL